MLIFTNCHVTHYLVKQVAAGSTQAGVLNTSPPSPIKYYSQVLLIHAILRLGDTDDLRKFLFCDLVPHGRWPGLAWEALLGPREATGASGRERLHLRQRRCPLPRPSVQPAVSGVPLFLLCYAFILAFVNSLLLDYGFHKGTTFCYVLFA